MKPSYDEQRKQAPATDRKFRSEDEHLLARNKEDVALSPHGDKLHAEKKSKRDGRDSRDGVEL